MHSDFWNQAISLVGAGCVLAAYVGHQMEWIDARGVSYNIINAVGSLLLGYIALFPFKIGFVVLESAWVLVSLYALMNVLRHRDKTAGEA